MEQSLKCHSCDTTLDSDELAYGQQQCENCEITFKAERIKILLDRRTETGYRDKFMEVLRIIMGHN